ncbi:hypothetical protein, partial [Pseudomonas aeruginosa]|uniref:hypothetical protein n=1 Tax=Pseudomonas aeruginosa TaxID=287 RepID=UPI001BFF8732
MLEISPARLSTCRASIAMPPFAAISPDWLLSSVSAALAAVVQGGAGERQAGAGDGAFGVVVQRAVDAQVDAG